MLQIKSHVKERPRSYLPIVIALSIGVSGAGCIEEVGDWQYCIALMYENHTLQTVEMTYSITPENATVPIRNDTQFLGPQGSFLDMLGTNERMHRVDVHHESGGIATRPLVAEPIPTNLTVVEYHPERIVFITQDTRDEGWKRNPCNYASEGQ